MEQYDLRPEECKERPVLPLCLSFIVFVSACLKVETHTVRSEFLSGTEYFPLF
jgi:hypothetical protein